MSKLWLLVPLQCIIPIYGLACGLQFSDVKTGEGVLGIEVVEDDSAAKNRVTLVDDNGMFAAGMIASYCYKNLENILVELSPKDQLCADDAQRSLEFSDRIFKNYTGESKPKALQSIKTACNLDLRNLYLQKADSLNSQPLTCAPKVKSFVAKILAQTKDYKKSQTDELALHPMPGILNDDAVNRLKINLDLMTEFNSLMNKNPPTRKDFDSWLYRFLAQIPYESLDRGRTKSDLDDDPLFYDSLPMVMHHMNAKLPGITGMKCGPDGLSDAVIDKLVTGDWQNAGTIKGRQSATVR